MDKICKSWTNKARNDDARHNANGKADLGIPYKSRNATLDGLPICLLKEKVIYKHETDNKNESPICLLKEKVIYKHETENKNESPICLLKEKVIYKHETENGKGHF